MTGSMHIPVPRNPWHCPPPQVGVRYASITSGLKLDAEGSVIADAETFANEAEFPDWGQNKHLYTATEWNGSSDPPPDWPEAGETVEVITEVAEQNSYRGNPWWTTEFIPFSATRLKYQIYAVLTAPDTPSFRVLYKQVTNTPEVVGGYSQDRYTFEEPTELSHGATTEVGEIVLAEGELPIPDAPPYRNAFRFLNGAGTGKVGLGGVSSFGNLFGYNLASSQYTKRGFRAYHQAAPEPVRIFKTETLTGPVSCKQEFSVGGQGPYEIPGAPADHFESTISEGWLWPLVSRSFPDFTDPPASRTDSATVRTLPPRMPDEEPLKLTLSNEFPTAELTAWVDGQVEAVVLDEVGFGGYPSTQVVLQRHLSADETSYIRQRAMVGPGDLLMVMLLDGDQDSETILARYRKRIISLETGEVLSDTIEEAASTEMTPEGPPYYRLYFTFPSTLVDPPLGQAAVFSDLAIQDNPRISRYLAAEWQTEPSN